MKKLLFILSIIFFTTLTCLSQVKIKRSSLSPGGGTSMSGNTKLISSVGELKTAEKSNGNTHLSEGFITPDIRVALNADDYTVLSGIRIYPNPVKENLYIENSNSDAYEIHLFNVTGKEIFLRPDNIATTKLNMSGYPSGIYIIGIIDRKNSKVKTFKFRKE